MTYAAFRLRCLMGVAFWALVMLAAIAAPARAQRAACAERAMVVERLADRYGETLRSMGLRGSSVVEVYSSDETGTWTILITAPNGWACVLAAGQMWEADAAPLGPQGDDT